MYKKIIPIDDCSVNSQLVGRWKYIASSLLMILWLSPHYTTQRAGTNNMTKQRAYQLLDCSPDATEQAIKSAYRKQALRWHPDRNLDNKEEATKKFQEIGAAYERVTKYKHTPDSQITSSLFTANLFE
ncbi:MAG: DnaJ domain-containing protein [Bacteroidota bacterium]